MPSKHLWIGNIPSNTSRRDLEHALSRYGQIKTLDYPTGDSIAIVTYIDVEDAMKARSKLMGAIQILDGRIQRNEPNSSRGKEKKRTIDQIGFFVISRWSSN